MVLARLLGRTPRHARSGGTREREHLHFKQSKTTLRNNVYQLCRYYIGKVVSYTYMQFVIYVMVELHMIAN